MKTIETSLQRIIKKKFAADMKQGEQYLADVQKRIHTSVDLDEAVRSTDLVIEAIVENLEIKQNLFKRIDSIAPPSVTTFESILNLLFLFYF